MKKIVLSLICVGAIWSSQAQLSIDAASTAYTIDFDSSVAGVNQSGYQGNGFSPNPQTGELDSDAWEIDEDGTMSVFGGTSNTAGSNFAKGIGIGGSGSTGFQAYEVVAGDTAFGIQPTGGTFTPGYITLRLINNTGATITDLNVDYDIYVYNDQARSNAFNLSHSANNSTYTSITALDFASPGTADANPAWVATAKSTTITGLNIADGAFYYLRWSGADVSGSGSRDEFALDNIAVTATTGVPNDVTPPYITSVSPLTSNTILVVFSEAVNNATALNAANYTGLGTVSNVVFTGTLMDSIELTLATPLSNGIITTLMASNVTDNSANNNVMVSSSHDLIFNNTIPDVIISEIMYNPPESGSDSLEAIELYNNGTTDAYLGGFFFENGIDFIFPSDTLSPGDFYLLAINQSAAESFYGVPFNGEFLGGGLSNGGELIKIVNTIGETIDSVLYDDNNPWPVGPPSPDGGGPSIQIIDYGQPNHLATNWMVSTINMVGTVNGTDVYTDFGTIANPPSTPQVNIVQSTYTVQETAGTIDIAVSLTNSNDAPSTVKFNVVSESTAAASDYTIPLALTFPGNVDTTMMVSVNITDDMDAEVSEYIGIVLADSANIEIGSGDVVTIFIQDDEYAAPLANGSIELEVIDTYTVTGGSSEISSFDSTTNKLFVANTTGQTIEVIDLSDPYSTNLIQSINVASYGNMNSIAVYHDTIAIAVEDGTDPQSNGSVVFFDGTGTFLNQVTVGAMPDMVVFSPDYTKVLSANEGEPNDDYTNDPEGSISIIDISSGVANATVNTLGFTAFNSQVASLQAAGVRVFGPGSTVAQDLEPEYITIDASSSTAWVTLQENNALAKIDLSAEAITDIYPLGYKDHSLPGNGMDVSNTSGEILIANWPVRGLYLPDAIASFEVGGSTYLVTANEGDARDYDGLEEEERIGSGDYELDSALYGDFGKVLKSQDNAGRLKCTVMDGDVDGDDDFDQVYTYGTRSFSIWDENGNLVWDSGDDFEQIIAADADFSAIFNCSNSNVTQKNRSDDKGPEPEGVTTGVINDTVYTFITLERVGGIMVYDVTDINAPKFVQYINNRDVLTATGDRGPEGIIYISDAESPIDTALLVVSNEVSGTVSVFKINHTVIPEPEAQFSEDLTAVCEGGSIQFTNESTGEPASFEWTFTGGNPASSTIESPLVTYNTPGVYDVKLVAINVTGSDTLELVNHITVNANPTTPIITQTGATILQSSEVSGNQWNDVNGIVAGAINQTFSPSVDGDYSVTYTDANGCSATSPMFSYSDYTGIASFEGEQVSIFPNPVNDQLNISVYADVEVLSLSGTILIQSKQTKMIDVSGLASGMYILRTASGQQVRFVKQ